MLWSNTGVKLYVSILISCLRGVVQKSLSWNTFRCSQDSVALYHADTVISSTSVPGGMLVATFKCGAAAVMTPLYDIVEDM